MDFKGFKFEPEDYRGLSEDDYKVVEDVTSNFLRKDDDQVGPGWNLTSIYNNEGFTIGPSSILKPETTINVMKPIPGLRMKIFQVDKDTVKIYGTAPAIVLFAATRLHEFLHINQLASKYVLKCYLEVERYISNTASRDEVEKVEAPTIPCISEIYPCYWHHYAISSEEAKYLSEEVAKFIGIKNEYYKAIHQDDLRKIEKIFMKCVFASPKHRKAFDILFNKIKNFCTPLLYRMRSIPIIEFAFLFCDLGDDFETSIIEIFRDIVNNRDAYEKMLDGEYFEGFEIIGVDLDKWKQESVRMIKREILKYENNLEECAFKQSINRLKNIKSTIDEKVPRRADAKYLYDFLRPFEIMGTIVIWWKKKPYILSGFDNIGLSFLMDLEIASRISGVDKLEERLKILQKMECPLRGNEFWECNGGGEDCVHIRPWIEHISKIV